MSPVLPPLISEVGQGLRQWLEHRRKGSDMEARLGAMEERLHKLEEDQRRSAQESDSHRLTSPAK